LASRAPTAAASPGSSGPGRGAAPHRRASMQIWTLCSTPRSTLRLVPRATALSAAGRCSAMSGNGRPPTSRHFPALLPTLMKIIHGRGSVRGRCCAAGAGRQAFGSLDLPIGISFLPIEMTYLPASAPALSKIENFMDCLCQRNNDYAPIRNFAGSAPLSQPWRGPISYWRISSLMRTVSSNPQSMDRGSAQ
jgi:hypothetical protein